MILSFDEYKDKVLGCWAGKNVGGVLGAPFEAFRQINDVEFYTQDLKEGPPPNDDLDLQIVWLSAVERYGRNVNASILGEYWLSFIIPNWVEYGMGKANLRAGLMPPMSGEVDNKYKDSCGCFIRSEIWACLAPGNPQIAVKYAYEDAIVDHSGEGVYGEIFFAALQSAAFVESDRMKLIDIALSYIPDDSKTSEAIKAAIKCYEDKVSFEKAREIIHNTAPGTFGVQLDKISEIEEEGLEIGEPGFDAPENVAFTIAGWLYGEGDFGKSLCTAVNFGEDTDCTGATLGAIMGIIEGESNLPEKWLAPLNDKIATLCIDKTSRGIWVPDTVTELTDRVMKTVPGFLGNDICDVLNKEGYTIKCKEGEELYCDNKDEYLHLINGMNKDEGLSTKELIELSPYVVRYDFPAFSVMVDYLGSYKFKACENRNIKVTVINSIKMRQQQWAKIKLYMPNGVEVVGKSSTMLPLNNLHGSKAESTFEFNALFYENEKLEFLIDVSLEGRHSSGSMKITMMRED